MTSFTAGLSCPCIFICLVSIHSGIQWRRNRWPIYSIYKKAAPIAVKATYCYWACNITMEELANENLPYSFLWTSCKMRITWENPKNKVSNNLCDLVCNNIQEFVGQLKSSRFDLSGHMKFLTGLLHSYWLQLTTIIRIRFTW